MGHNRPERRSGPEFRVQAAPNSDSDFSIDDATDIGQYCDAFVIVVVTPDDKIRRRTYMSLHSAEKALKRAWAAKRSARMVLCRMQPVAGEETFD